MGFISGCYIIGDINKVVPNFIFCGLYKTKNGVENIIKIYAHINRNRKYYPILYY